MARLPKLALPDVRLAVMFAVLAYTPLAVFKFAPVILPVASIVSPTTKFLVIFALPVTVNPSVEITTTLVTPATLILTFEFASTTILLLPLTIAAVLEAL